MKAVIYCRVSTEDQEKEGTSLQTQKEACLEYCRNKGYKVVNQFIETYSGLTLDRPKLSELRELVRANEVDVVVIYCIDRLSRDPYHGVIITQELEQYKVLLEAVTETLESSEIGKLITYIRGFASKLEAEKIKERTTRGKIARLKEGKLPHGTGKGIYGYKWDKQIGKRLIDESESKVVQKIFSMVLRGISFNKIAIELNKAGVKSKSGSLWHPLTIRRMVGNETYTGKTYSGRTKRIGKSEVVIRPKEEWYFLPDVTPAIVSEDVFSLAQEAICQAKLSRPLKEHASYLLTGFMWCSKCGSPIGGTMLGHKYRYYQCRGAKPTSTRGKICDAGYIRANEFEKDIWNNVVELASSPFGLLGFLMVGSSTSGDEINRSIDKEINQIRKKLKAYPTKEKNIIGLLENEIVTKEYVIESINKIKKERSSDENQLKLLLETKNQSIKVGNKLKLSEFSENIRIEIAKAASSDDIGYKRKLLDDLMLRVTADPKSYSFNFKFFGNWKLPSEYGIKDFINEKYVEFEKLHPEIKIDELVDYNKMLPEDSKFGCIINSLKKMIKAKNQNLVTIAQTSASLHARSLSRLTFNTYV
jgi:site-specific DNA recombinase